MSTYAADLENSMRTRAAGQGIAARFQRGLSLFSLIVSIGVIAFLVIMGARCVLPWNEYFAIQRALNKIESSGEVSVADARKAFDRYAEIDRIDSITAKDIHFEQVDGRGYVGHFEYEARVPLVGNVYLLFHFQN